MIHGIMQLLVVTEKILIIRYAVFARSQYK